MKATGIVRRIDDLGRVVIPKEIRRTLRLREGDPLEIFTGDESNVIFKKYSPIGELQGISSRYAEVLFKIGCFAVLICDTDRIVSAAGISKRESVDQRITPAVETILNERKLYAADGFRSLLPMADSPRAARAISPILVGGDICGGVILLQPEQEEGKCNSEELKLLTLASGFIAKQMEE